MTASLADLIICLVTWIAPLAAAAAFLLRDARDARPPRRSSDRFRRPDAIRASRMS